MVQFATFLSFFGFLFLLSGGNNVSAAGVNLGGMESWGFNGIRSGEVTMMSPTSLKIRGLGEGPAVWFMMGKEDEPYNEEFADLKGVIIPDETGSCDRLARYRNENIVLRTPAGLKFTDYDYLAVYCTRFNHNFGYVHLKMKNGDTPSFDLAANETSSRAPKPCPQDHLDEEEDEEKESGEKEAEKEEEEEDEEEDDLNESTNRRIKKNRRKSISSPQLRRA